MSGLVFQRIRISNTLKDMPILFADYIIEFKYPLRLPKNTGKEVYEAKVVEAYNSLTTKLLSVGLKCEVRPGDKGTLLVFVVCPWSRLRDEVSKARIQDYLTGVRIDYFEESPNKALATENLGVSSSSDVAETLTDSERLRLVYSIITSPTTEGGAGITPGVDTYVASILPLHDRKFDNEWILSWSQKWILDHDDFMKIRDHFGETVAYYFAFLQFYLLSLSVPAAVGIIIYFFDSIYVSGFYAIFIVLWGLLFVDGWRRRERELAIWWGVRNLSKVEKVRPGYIGDYTVKDAITGEAVPVFPVWKKFMRRAASFPVLALAALGLSAVVGFVFTLEVFLHEYYRGPFHEITTYLPTIAYSALIPTLSSQYIHLATALNNWENHKTHSEHHYHLTLKIFIVNFLTAYLSLFITAFIYIPFGDSILPYFNVLNIEVSHQTVGPERLKKQLIYFVVTGQLVNFATEVIVPFVIRFATKKGEEVVEEAKRAVKKKKSNEDPSQAFVTSEEERAFLDEVIGEVALRQYDVYEDYAEMVSQFGYVSMFSSVWPITPLIALVNNMVELRSDAVKICRNTRRPIPQRSDSIGPWIESLTIITWLSSLTSSSLTFLFQRKTDLTSFTTVGQTLLVVFIAEHIFILLRVITSSIFKAIPSWTDEIIRKEEYELKMKFLGNNSVTNDKKVFTEGDKKVDELFANSAAEGVEIIRAGFKTV